MAVTCPNCGAEFMDRPGNLPTCSQCFWVVDGENNDYVLPDWGIKYRHAQMLLDALGEDWHGTPGTVGTRLYEVFDDPDKAKTLIARAVWKS